MRRDVRRAVGVHADNVVFVFALLQAQAAILHVDGQVGHVHVEVFAAHFHDLRVDLEAVDGQAVVPMPGCGGKALEP